MVVRRCRAVVGCGCSSFFANVPTCLVDGGGLRERALLGAGDREGGTRNQVDCTAIREALREGQRPLE
jgi:hypothetical protein